MLAVLSLCQAVALVALGIALLERRMAHEKQRRCDDGEQAEGAHVVAHGEVRVDSQPQEGDKKADFSGSQSFFLIVGQQLLQAGGAAAVGGTMAQCGVGSGAVAAVSVPACDSGVLHLFLRRNGFTEFE